MGRGGASRFGPRARGAPGRGQKAGRRAGKARGKTKRRPKGAANLAEAVRFELTEV